MSASTRAVEMDVLSSTMPRLSRTGTSYDFTKGASNDQTVSADALFPDSGAGTQNVTPFTSIAPGPSAICTGARPSTVRRYVPGRSPTKEKYPSTGVTDRAIA